LVIGYGIELLVWRLERIALPGERPIRLTLKAGSAAGIAATVEHRDRAALKEIRRRTGLGVNRGNRESGSYDKEHSFHSTLSEIR
jgi:hypothetical protein